MADIFYKKFPLTKEMDKRLKAEVSASGINGNAVVILALDEYLKKKEKERTKT